MYTQCPECSSIFEISATDLAVAGGFVRCGQCATSFDALSSLSDNSAALKQQPRSSKSTLKSLKTKTPLEQLQPAATPNNGTAGTDEADDESRGAQTETADTETISETEQPGTEVAGAIESETGTDEEAAALSDLAAEEDHPASEADNEETASVTAETAPDQVAESEPEATDDNADQAVEAAAEATEDEGGDVDEILLDDDYRPPSTDEDDPYYDDDTDDEYDETLATEDEGSDEYGDTLATERNDSDDSDDDTLSAEGSESGDDDVASLSPDNAGTDAIATTHDESGDTSEAAVDESALFALPLPELTPLEHSEPAVLPEKLEGGEAAHVPSAQSRAPKNDRAQTDEMPQVVPSIWARQQNDAYDAEDARDLRDYLSAPVNPAARAAWGAGTALMLLLLIVQVIHSNRSDLVIHPRLGPVVSKLYNAVGVELQPNWRINDYKIIGQARLFLMPLDADVPAGATDERPRPDESDTATADYPDDATAIRFVAIISNGAKQAQPAPLVRLTLRDRWGDPTGARDFTPPEYLADRTMIGRLLEPGQRLRVVLNLYDFGSDAVGFDFDMCLPDDKGTLRCAHES